MAGLLASGRHSLSLLVGTVSLVIGFFAFMLVLVLVAKAKDAVAGEATVGYIAISCVLGMVAYKISMIFICIHMYMARNMITP